MRFILNMARREMRASWRRLLFFFICIGVGVGAIVALRSIIGNINRAVAAEARQLLAADVQLDNSRASDDETKQKIERVINSSNVTARTESVELPTMIRSIGAKEAAKDKIKQTAQEFDDEDEGAMMIELKAVAPPYPLAGELALVNDQKFDFDLLENNGAVVAPLLLERLKLRVGDRIKIGDRVFQIRGVIAREPGGGGAGFRLGPRVFIHRNAIDATGLTGFGGRARHKILLTVRDPSQVDSLVNNLRAAVKGKQVAVNSYKDSQDNLREQFRRAENYLSLTGLIVLVLGGIGVANVTRVFVEQKKRAIAALKVLGGTSRQITAAYLLQILTLGIAGSFFGVLLARATLLVVEYYLSESLPKGTSYGLSANAVGQGLTLGFIVSAIFAALPLLRIRNIKPNSLLRESVERETEDATRRKLFGIQFDARIILTGGGVCAVLLALASWQAGSWRVGVSFVGGLLGAILLLQIAATTLLWFLRHTRKRFASFALRQAISGLQRPGNQTRVVIIAVGLGVFLMLAVQSLERNLLDEFDASRRSNLPNLYAFDIQPEQAEDVARFIEETSGEKARLVPAVRARIVSINGQEVDLNAREAQRERFRLGREYVVTYRSMLDENEDIVAGKFWDSTPLPPDSQIAEISVEEGMRGLLGLDIGSMMTLDVLGRRINARVTSIREVDWRNARTGFMILFRPGTLESAPHTFIVPLNNSPNEDERARFQRRLIERFPNIAVIDVGDILKTVTKILGSITLAVSFIGGFVFLSGALILIGSVSMTKFQRVYETAVLKTLGAKRGKLIAMLLAEYALLGLVAALVGAFAAIGLSYATTHYVLELTWSLKPLLFIIGIIATVLLVTLVGAFSSFDVLTRKPLATLRAE